MDGTTPPHPSHCRLRDGQSDMRRCMEVFASKLRTWAPILAEVQAPCKMHAF